MDRNDLKTLRTLLILAAAALFLAIAPILPYGFYVLLRLFACAVSIYFVIELKTLQTLKSHKIPLIIIAILCSPLIPTYSIREVWFPFDIGIGFYLIFLIMKLSPIINQAQK